MTLTLALLIIAIAVYAVARRADVRLCLFTAALAIGFLARDPVAIVRTFFTTMTNEKFVVPLCCALGFAQVLRRTECDRHLVHLLVRPLKKVRWLLVPGTVLVGFLVNMPIISQTSTAVVIGPVVIPVLLAARLSPITVGATLLLGTSIGGELLNPGAPELRTVVTETAKAASTDIVEPQLTLHGGSAAVATHLSLRVTSADCVNRIFPLILVGLTVATLLFWYMCSRAERGAAEPAEPDDEGLFRINYVKAIVPLVPLVILYIAAPPFEFIPVSKWLNLADPNATAGQHETRFIAIAMLFGVLVAITVVPSAAPDAGRAFCEGAGYAYANIISLIVAATCFGKAIELVGVAALIGDVVQAMPTLLLPVSGLTSLAFGTLCGSGMATTQSLFGFFVRPAIQLGIDPVHVGAVVSIASAAGRTMSPVAAVTLMCASMTKTSPFDLVKRVALPLVAGILTLIVVAMLWTPRSY